MKCKSKINARLRFKQVMSIGGILIFLFLINSQNLAILPENFRGTNVDFPNEASSEIPTLYSISPNPNTIGIIKLSWSAVSGKQYYLVYVSTSPLTQDNITNHQYDNYFYSYSTTFTDYEQNGIYYYVVTSVDFSYIESNCSNCESVTVAATAPSTAPTLNVISPNPSNSPYINLFWSAVDKVYDYKVYRSNSPITSGNIGSLFPIMYVNAPQTQYTDFVNTNETYYYAIVAVNGGGTSEPSNCESVVVTLYLPEPPILSTITPNPNIIGNITLSWSTVSDAQYYIVYESTSPLTEENITNYQYNNNFWADFSPFTVNEQNGIHYFVVTAVNIYGLESDCSNCESVTVAATAPSTAPTLDAISPNPSNSPYITLSWSAINNAYSYYVYMSASPITSGNIGSLYPIAYINAPETTYLDFEKMNGTYYYAIVAVNGGGASEPSNCESVVLILYLLEPPILSTITPNPNTIGDITLSWSAVSDAEYYMVYVSSSPLTEENITNYQYDNNIFAFSTTVTDYEQNGTHYYVVTAIDSNNLESYCSNCESVTVAATTPSTAPTLDAISPNPSNSPYITLSWSAVNNVYRYEVYKSIFPITSENIIILYPIMYIDAPQTTLMDFDNTNGTYYYAIVAVNGGGTSELSNCESVERILYLPEAPILSFITPNPNTIGDITLSWSAVTNAQYYCVYGSTSPLTEEKIANYQFDQMFFTSDTTITIYEQNGIHYYVVTVVDNNDLESNCSNCESVTVAATAPSTAPTLNAISPNPSNSPQIFLSWSEVNDAYGYAVYMSDSLITSENIGSLNPIVYTNSPSTTYEDFENANGTYYYAIVAVNGGGTSEPSNCQSVELILYQLEAPILSPITPNPNTIGNVTLSWSAVSGADHYMVYESTLPLTEDMIKNYQYESSFWAYTTTLIVYEENGQHYYVVTAVNSDYIESNCSNCESVTVTATTPTAPTLTTISPNPSNSPYITLSWSAVNNAYGYNVYMSDSPINSGNIGSLYPIGFVNSPQTTFIDFEDANGTYYYAIVAVNGGGTSEPSNCESVTTAISPVPMNTYVGVSPGDSFQYNYTVQMPEMNGTYKVVITVDNITDLGISALIGYHMVMSNSTNSSIETYYYEQTIGAYDITPPPSGYPFINKNIPNKTLCFNYSGVIMSAIWDDNGVLLILNNSYSGGFMILNRITQITAPQNLHGIPGDQQIFIEWDPPSDNGGSPITNYSIYRSTSSGAETYLTTVGNVTFYTDTGLSYGTTYYYKVSAINGDGEGPLSSEASSTTYGYPTEPTNLQAIPGVKQINLTWDPPINNRDSAIMGYNIYRGNLPGGETLLTTIGNVTSFTDTGLSDDTTYHYKVTAINAFGEGPRSSEVSATTLLPLSAPRNLQAIPGDKQITLNWDVPSSDGGSTIIGYNIYKGTSSGNEVFLEFVYDMTTYLDTGLSINSTYYYKVSAINGVGEGPKSSEISATTYDYPTEPINLQATPGLKNIHLNWEAPLNNGGSEITNYKIYRGNSSGTEVYLTTVSQYTSYLDTSLQDDTTFYYKVSAVNIIGEGANSSEVSATTSSLPTEPKNLQAIAGVRQITLSWEVPIDNGGQPIYEYRIYLGNSSGAEVYLFAIGNVTTYTIPNLPDDTTYYFKVSAVNYVGEGSQSTEASAKTFALPTAPINVKAVPGLKHINITWDPPSDNGGSPIIGYMIYSGDSSGNERLLGEISNITTYTDLDLLDNLTLYYRVSAVTEVGEGPLSSEVNATTFEAPSGIGGMEVVPILLVSFAGVTMVVVTVKKRLKLNH